MIVSDLESLVKDLDGVRENFDNTSTDIAVIAGDIEKLKRTGKLARGGRLSGIAREEHEKALQEMYEHLDKVGMSLYDLGGVSVNNQGKYSWSDFFAGVDSKDAFLFESDAIEDFTKYLKKAYPAGKKMAHGGIHRQGYDDKLDESLAMRRGAGRTKEQSRKDRRDESAGMEKSMGRRKYSSVGTMDIDDRMI